MSVEETASAILAPPSPAEIRAELEQLFLKNIVGPEGGEDEELDHQDGPFCLGLLPGRHARANASAD